MTELSDFEIVEQLGSGSFGKVMKVRSKKDQQLYVWKEIDYSKMSEKEKQLIVSGRYRLMMASTLNAKHS